MQNKRVVLLNEKIAKKLFKNEKYGKELSARLISDFLEADYKEVYDNLSISTDEIAFSSLTVNSTADAIYYDDKCYFNIELNFYGYDGKIVQLESYVYQLYLGQLRSCKDYRNIKKIIQISIDNFDILKKNEFTYRFMLMDDKYHIPYNGIIELLHINIDFVRNLDYNEVVKSSNKLIKDFYFFVCDDDKLIDKVYKKDELMKKIIEEAKKIAGVEKMDLYLTDEELMKQDQEYYYNKGHDEGYDKGINEGYDKGINEGYDKGINEGYDKGINEMIVNMYNNGYRGEDISKITRKSIDYIKGIINEINSK